MTESGAESPFAPLFLLADSRLLFPTSENPSLLDRVRRHLPDDPSSAYLGAANGDDADAWALFEAAMDGAGIRRRRMVRSAFPDDDRAWLAEAELVVLAGGDPERGWRLFRQAGIDDVLRERYAAGAVLLGVSAGAVHLGWDHLDLVPALVGAHEEREGWADLARRVRRSPTPVRGLGLPFGGGLVCHPDGTIEPLRLPVHELVPEGGDLRHGLLLPQGGRPGRT